VLKVKLLAEHTPACVTIRDPEQTRRRGGGAYTWHLRLEPQYVEQRDAAGGLRGYGYGWLHVTCSSTGCPAVAIVRLDTLAVEIQAALDSKGGGDGS
jgi:hypothetical protein